MGSSKRACVLLLCLTIVISFSYCDARRPMNRGPKHMTTSVKELRKKFKALKHLDAVPLASTDTDPYVSSPFTMPPFDSLPPQNAPPNCIYPPSNPQAPSTTVPTPTGDTPSLPPPYYLSPLLPSQSPPPGPPGSVPSSPDVSSTPNAPEVFPSPSSGGIPGTPESIPSPPRGGIPGTPESIPSPPGSIIGPPYNEPSPPSYIPSPSTNVPSPIGFVPSPPVFLPPIVYPPPLVPPSPPNTAPTTALWCVAKPSVPDPIIQEAMSYACGSGADCDSIQPNGPCFQPNTLFAHASYAFNSYWQSTKVAGGTCSFGGTAMLVTVDPSYDACHFMYN